jgi:hypothetical protein
MPTAEIRLRVYHDAVRVEIDGRMLGWFADEVSAVSAAMEHALMASADYADNRKLPELSVRSEYLDDYAKVPWVKFKRATRVNLRPGGRRVVMVPGTFGKPWIQKPTFLCAKT